MGGIRLTFKPPWNPPIGKFTSRSARRNFSSLNRRPFSPASEKWRWSKLPLKVTLIHRHKLELFVELIAFPTQCQNRIEDYRSILALYQKVRASSPDRVIFDCGNVNFFRPLGLNLLACFISELLLKNPHSEIYFTPPKNQKVFDYIKHQGFFECFLPYTTLFRSDRKSVV